MLARGGDVTVHPLVAVAAVTAWAVVRLIPIILTHHRIRTKEAQQ